MRILVTGAGGGLGRAFRACVPREHEVHGFTRHDLDVTDFAEVVERVVPLRPDVVLHLAAMTGVDACEADPRRAGQVNVLGTFNVAYAAERSGALLVHTSTDYVFGGEKEMPYDERDEPRPLSVYGGSKLEGERVARVIAPAHLIVRTAWVFGAGNDFVSESVRLLAAGEQVRGIVDQVGSPTYVAHLAERLMPVIDSGARGVVHLVGPEAVTWYDVLVRAKELGDLPGEVIEQKAVDLGRPAPRPANSALVSVVLSATDVSPMPPLDDAIRKVLADVGA